MSRRDRVALVIAVIAMVAVFAGGPLLWKTITRESPCEKADKRAEAAVIAVEMFGAGNEHLVAERNAALKDLSALDCPM